MDDFIIEHSDWFEYMGVAVVIFFVFAIAFLILAIAMKTKKPHLKSRKKKSVFARSYIDIAVSTAISTPPVRRLSTSDSLYHRKRESISENPMLSYGGETIPPQSLKQNEVYITNNMQSNVNKRHNFGNHVIEVYFEYEDDYKI